MFFKVKSNFNGRRVQFTTLIGGELYSEKEAEEMQIPQYMLKRVNLDSGNTYVYNGVRFEKHSNVNNVGFAFT